MPTASPAHHYRNLRVVDGDVDGFAAAGKRDAFSLVEVMVAIGLVTFAMLVIFSLMPVGLHSLQESNRQIVETEIFNTLGAELSSTPFDQVTNYLTQRFPVYFDNEGMEQGGSSNAVFIARCAVAAVPESNTQLNRVIVSIGYRRDPAQTNTPGKFSKRAFLLVNKGI
jgi:uncharacterized protein (TIGR02598 family)